MSCNKSLDILNQNEIYNQDNVDGSVNANEYIILSNVDINYKPAQDKYDVAKVYNIYHHDTKNCVYSHNTRTFSCSTTKNHTNDKNNNENSELLLNSTINTENKFNEEHKIDKKKWKQLISEFPKQFNKLSAKEAPILKEGGIVEPPKSNKMKRILIVLVILLLLSFCFKNNKSK